MRIASTRRRGAPEAGFTLIEVICSIAVLTIAGLGGLQALLMASQNLAQGRFQDIKGELAEAHSQAMLLENRNSILAMMTPVVAPWSWTPPALPALGSGPWVVDPGGAYFRANTAGIVTPVTGITNTSNTCGDSGIPPGTICREMMITQGAPQTYGSWEVAGANPSWGTMYALYTRVSMKPVGGQDLTPAVYVEIFTQ